MAIPLGLRKYVALYSIRGLTTPQEADRLVQWTISCITMGTSGLRPVVIVYPVMHGGQSKGGKGFTLVQPITTSVIYEDYWEEHQGYYLMIASCQWFSARLLAWRLKWKLKKRGHKLLGYDTCQGSLE